jgi:hypothetical protein
MLLTTDDLSRILTYAQNASPAPVSVIQVPDDQDPCAWFADALAQTVGTTVYGVALGDAEDIEGQGAIFTAFTGNGAHALANANFYALCHTAVPLLVAEVQRLRARMEEDVEEAP